MEFTHIRDELLDASDPTHPIRIAFSARNITSLQGLQRLLKNADNITSLKSYTDDTIYPHRKNPYELDKEDLQDLRGLPSYLIMLQNEYGPLSSGSMSILSLN